MPLDSSLRDSIAGNTGHPAEAVDARPPAKLQQNEPVKIAELNTEDRDCQHVDSVWEQLTTPTPQSIPTPNPIPAADSSATVAELQGQVQKLSTVVETLCSQTKTQDFSQVLLELKTISAKIDLLPTKLNKTIPERSDDERSAFTSFSEIITKVIEKQEKNDRLLTQALRENANFQVQVRQGMQKDLDRLKDQQRGAHLIPILKQVASIYVDYQMLLRDKSITGTAQKNLISMFEALEDLLADYDAEPVRSKPGEIRQPKLTKIAEKIPIGDERKHNTIACSRTPGFVLDRTVLSPEYVEVYVYDPTLSASESTAIAPTEAVEPDVEDLPEATESAAKAPTENAAFAAEASTETAEFSADEAETTIEKASAYEKKIINTEEDKK